VPVYACCTWHEPLLERPGRTDQHLLLRNFTGMKPSSDADGISYLNAEKPAEGLPRSARSGEALAAHPLHSAVGRPIGASRTGHARLRRKTWAARSPATYVLHS
jgi:hypothetical protein